MSDAVPPYVELHAHSGFSFLDGASHPEELVLRAQELGYPALALTDHDGLYGSMEFAQRCREVGLQPITGAEVTLRDCGLPEEEGLERGTGRVSRETSHPGSGVPRARAPSHVGIAGHGARARSHPSIGSVDGGTALTGGPATRRPDEAGPRFHVTLLAESPTGYANLCRLLTEARMGSPREDPALPLESLLARTEGLILLTGCRRSPLLHALEDSNALGEAFLRRLVRAFGAESVFVELQQNDVRGDAPRNRALARLADRMGVPVVATGNVHYHRPERFRLQDVLTAVHHRTTLDGSHDVRRGNCRFHLAAPEEAARRFASRPDALRNTLRIAERCAAFDLTRDLGYAFPDFEGGGNGKPAIRVLAEVCRAALEKRYGDKRREEAERRLEEELELVEHHGLAGFFLVYRDIMEMARKVAARVRKGSPRAHASLPPGRGRGSSVSSIVCYLIGLSHVDPIATNLSLGRFLNEALESVPDIDLDFPRDIREELILEVYRRYGDEHAGLVATFPTYRLRSAVREVGGALDLPIGDLEKLTKLVERRSAGGLADELAEIPGFAEKAESPLWRLLAELAEEAAGLPRHVSQHVGGMIISSRPLVELVPLEPAAMEGRVLCQWDKDSCEDAGFIKIDFLALGMLSLVEEATDLIAERGTGGAGGEPTVHGAPDLSRIDFSDPAVYDRIADGDTVGIFQVESRAQIQMLRRVRPRSLEELAVQVAVVRPGPIVGGAVNPYVSRREALREDPDYRPEMDHPLLENALGETLGVIIYQDQVLHVCRDLAGFSDGQAEGLRRAMSRKRSREIMQGYKEAFIAGARERGVDTETAERVFRQVAAFSEFGFPKSHAAAFALLAYQSAWLRHYYPTEYYTALFNSQPMGFYSLDALARDARRNGVGIRLPNVNRSGAWAVPEEGDLRVGLGFVRGWGEEIAEGVVAERERGGPFRSLTDFLRRTPAALRRPSVENLVWVGGFDSLGLTRRELLWQVGLWLGPEEERERRAAGREDDPQLDLGLADPYAALPFPDLDDAERMVSEYRMLTFATERHPLELVRHQLPPETVTADALETLEPGRTVRVAGVVVARQRPQTAKGYIFLLIEDEAGPVNVIVKPRVYERCRAAVRMEPFVLVRGKLQRDGKTVNVIAHAVEPLRPALGDRDGGTAVAEHVPDPLEYWPGPPRHAGSEREGDGDAAEGGARGAASAEAASPDDSAATRVAPAAEAGTDGSDPNPFAYLKALRSAPPEARSWG